jgi:hypothetical protein
MSANRAANNRSYRARKAANRKAAMMALLKSDDYRRLPFIDGYIVTASGKIYSEMCSRFRELKCMTLANGYKSLEAVGDGGTVRLYLHRVVCTMFHGQQPDGAEVCHNDGVRTNNAASNLRWGTRRENHQDSVSHGTVVHWGRRVNTKGVL